MEPGTFCQPDTLPTRVGTYSLRLLKDLICGVKYVEVYKKIHHHHHHLQFKINGKTQQQTTALQTIELHMESH